MIGVNDVEFILEFGVAGGGGGGLNDMVFIS